MKKRLLFVCMGNICRSPAAEGIMKGLVKKNGLDSQIICDSAGTSSYHVGDPADARMIAFAKERGWILDTDAREFVAEDFEKFDYILTMDKNNFKNVMRLDPEGKFRNKVIPMTNYCKIHQVDEVPDPYYQGDDGFTLVLDILEDACGEMLSKLKLELGK